MGQLFETVKNTGSEWRQGKNKLSKTFPKKMLGEYLLGQLYENKEDYKRASKSYLNAFQMDSIGDLKKQMMMDKSDEMRSKIGKPQKK